MGYGAFAYIGSKGNLTERIIETFPPHRTYVEVFGGSAAVLITKNPSPVEIYNDLNSDIVNFMLQVRDNLPALQKYLLYTLYSRELYEQWLEEWRQDRKPADNMERAARWFFIQCSSVNQRFGSSWRCSKIKNIAQEYYRFVGRLPEVASRMRSVQIEHEDFRKVIPIYDSEETLFYLDPPYDLTASGLDAWYGTGFSTKDHCDLAEILSQIQGKAIVSYCPSPLIDSLYRGWSRTEITATRSVRDVRKRNGRKAASELLLCNYEPLPLFRIQYHSP